MGKYINFTLIKEREEKNTKEFEQSMILLELANKEAKIQKLEQENTMMFQDSSMILLELAIIKGGMQNVV